MPARFLQIHTLTSYPATLLNRDDAGFAKRMPFGGVVRTRISSQCQKRHWRVYDGEQSLGTIDAPESVRSRIAFERYVVEPLVKEGVALDTARRAARKLIGRLFGSEAKQEKAEKKTPKKKDDPASEPIDSPASTAQVTVLGKPELDYLCQLAREVIATSNGDTEKLEKAIEERTSEKTLKENLRALKPGSLEAGLGAALFGRMVTGDILSRTDAAIHVAHAMTVHGQMVESDYFTAIDDLVREDGDQGSGHVNASELTSGLFYAYVVVDVSGLVTNLGGDRMLAGDVVERLVHMVSTVSPGAKKGSTAPYAYSHLVLVESGDAQPRTLQNAFLEPISSMKNLIDSTYEALQQHLADLDAMYGKRERRAHAGLRTENRFEGGRTLPELAAWTKEQLVA